MEKIFVKSCNGSFVLPIEVKYGEVNSADDNIVTFNDGRWCRTQPQKDGDTYWEEVSEAPSFEEECRLQKERNAENAAHAAKMRAKIDALKNMPSKPTEKYEGKILDSNGERLLHAESSYVNPRTGREW